MMKQILSTLLASTALLIVSDLAMPAWAQTSNNETTQTDKSEEDWRKSRKKTATDDIFEDILNRRSTGSGSAMGPENPMESLPEESRRHLMKERAKVIATSNPGEAVTTPYTPSEAAKTDAELQEQEKEAWDKIVKDMNGGQGQGSGQSQGQGQAPSQGQPQTGSQSGGQAGQNGSSDQNGQSSGNSNASSPLRGGSSASVSDILAKIKGLQGGSGSAPQGSKPAGNETGIAKTPGAQIGADQSKGQSKGQSASGDQSAEQGQAGSQSADQSPSQEASQGAAQDMSQSQISSSSAAQSSSQAAVDAAAQDAHAQAHGAAPQSPLDRIQARKRNAPSQTSGKRTSASDYLKTSD